MERGRHCVQSPHDHGEHKHPSPPAQLLAAFITSGDRMEHVPARTGASARGREPDTRLFPVSPSATLEVPSTKNFLRGGSPGFFFLPSAHFRTPAVFSVGCLVEKSTIPLSNAARAENIFPPPAHFGALTAHSVGGPDEGDASTTLLSARPPDLTTALGALFTKNSLSGGSPDFSFSHPRTSGPQ